MGAWGHHFDENDGAADWLAEFEDEPNWDIVGAAFRNVTSDPKAYVEVDEGSAALAAAEIVAASRGRGSQRLPEVLSQWATANAGGGAALIEPARSAIAAVRDGGELRELWDESEEASDWLSTVDDLISRLK